MVGPQTEVKTSFKYKIERISRFEVRNVAKAAKKKTKKTTKKK